MDNQRNIRDMLEEIRDDNEALYNVLDIFVQMWSRPCLDRMSIITREGVEYINIPMSILHPHYKDWTIMDISVNLDINFNVVQCTVGIAHHDNGPLMPIPFGPLDERHYDSLIEAIELINYDRFVDLVQASSLQKFDFDDDSVKNQNERMELMQHLEIYN